MLRDTMLHVSMTANFPGLFEDVLRKIGFTNFKIGEGYERLTCTDPDKKILIEIQHCTTPISPASMTHLGIVSDDANMRKKASEAIRNGGSFQKMKTSSPQIGSSTLGILTIRKDALIGRMSFEVSTPRTHSSL